MLDEGVMCLICASWFEKHHMKCPAGGTPGSEAPGKEGSWLENSNYRWSVQTWAGLRA